MLFVLPCQISLVIHKTPTFEGENVVKIIVSIDTHMYMKTVPYFGMLLHAGFTIMPFCLDLILLDNIDINLSIGHFPTLSQCILSHFKATALILKTVPSQKLICS